MKQQTIKHIAFSAIALFSSCTATHFLPADEKLYTGADIKVVSNEKLKNKKIITRLAESTLKQKPNKKFLGMRPALWLYFAAGDSSKSRFRKWLKEKPGEPPVYISAVKPSEYSGLIDAKLFNAGIFEAHTSYSIHEKKKTASVSYICTVHNPYRIQKIKFPQSDDRLSVLIRESENKSILKSGTPYSLDNLKAERERLDGVLKNNGFYFFNSGYILFEADTNNYEKTVSLEVTIKKEAPAKALTPYKLNNIYIEPDYSLDSINETTRQMPFTRDSILFKSAPNMRPRVILRSIFLRPGDIYSRDKHNMTLNRLMTMGNFKFVSIKFTERDSDKQRLLDADIFLTRMPKRTFRSEVDFVSKSSDFLGPRLTLSYRNRNALNGAELLTLSLSSSIETQLSGKYKNLFSYEIGPQIEFYIPRFVVPFKIKNPTSYYIPKTRFMAGYSYMKRIDYFNLASLKFLFGYKWKENIKTEHELNPVNVTYLSVSNKSETFSALLESNPFLMKNYEEQLIAGILYNYTFNEQVIETQKNQFYINPSVELAGNMLTAFNKIFYGETPSAENPQRFAGIVYSQFVRLAVDIRHYFNFSKKNKIVLRFYSGLGKAYGNSVSLPYSKQFFSGGPNSIRAFEINSLGPGTYIQDKNSTSAFLEYGGDLKLEANAEYRFNIIRILKGALFIDAGNSWLLKSNPGISSPPFSINRFSKELAAGTGFGLRIDASFFVIRFDLAMPLRKPWLNEHERWVIDQIDFGSSSWRKDNLILNIAIGYPF